MAEGNLVDMNTGDTEPSVETGPKPKAPPATFWVPETKNYVLGSAAELDQRMKAGWYQVEERAPNILPKRHRRLDGPDEPTIGPHILANLG